MGNKKATAAILGYGTVGSGVFEVLRTNMETISLRTGIEIGVKYVLDLRDFEGDPVREVLVHDYETILADPEVSIIVETMGGLTPAYDFTKRALASGRSVCTSNKELVAEHGVELLAIAKEHGANYMFEASCGGGIPIIRAMTDCLLADEIDQVSGILNGTTNYILTKMTNDGSEFSDALKEAQEAGYAERDPSADIEGHDARRKIAILSSIAYGGHVDYRDVDTTGIAEITAADIRYAKELGARIKLIASSRLENDTVSVDVCPVMVGPENPLYAVDDVFNAVLVHGNMLGDAMFYGSGAGRLPTASAVAADVVSCAVNSGRHIPLPLSGRDLKIRPASENEARYFVRVKGDSAEKGPAIEAALGKADFVSMPGMTDEFAFVTGPVSEAVLKQFLSSAEGLIGRRIRVEF